MSAILNPASGVSCTTSTGATLHHRVLLEQRATGVLRSTTNNDFYVPPSRSRYGDIMFSVAGPRVWNSLPAEIKKTDCITDLLEQRATRALRSITNNDFYVPPSRSRYGDIMFSVAGPRVWNSLPAEIKKTDCIVTFKRLLKTHLFRAVYEV